MDWENVIKNLNKTGDYIPYDVTFNCTGCGLFMTDDLEKNQKDQSPNESKVSAHKFILAMVSDVFNRMFNGSLPEKSEIKIEDCSKNGFKTMIDWIYLRVPETETDTDIR